MPLWIINNCIDKAELDLIKFEILYIKFTCREKVNAELKVPTRGSCARNRLKPAALRNLQLGNVVRVKGMERGWG